MGDDMNILDELRQREEWRGGEGSDGDGRPGRDWRSRKAEEADDGEAAGESEMNSLAYGFYRGTRDRAAHIEFQRLKGSWPAPGYAWLPCPVWVPTVPGGRGQAVVLEYVTGLKVTVRGRNLRPLYERMLRQQVFRVTETGEEPDRYLPDDATVVYVIDVEEPEKQGE